MQGEREGGTGLVLCSGRSNPRRALWNEPLLIVRLGKDRQPAEAIPVRVEKTARYAPSSLPERVLHVNAPNHPADRSRENKSSVMAENEIRWTPLRVSVVVVAAAMIDKSV